MMSNIVHWGIIISFCGVTGPLAAQTNWGTANRWLVDTNKSHHQAMTFPTNRPQETPTPPPPTPQSEPASTTEPIPGPNDSPIGSGALGSGALIDPGHLENREPTDEQIISNHHEIGSTDRSCHSSSACGSAWFGGVYVLGLSLTDDHGVELSYDSANPFPAMLTTDSIDLGSGLGLETRLGKYLNDSYGVEFSYWGVFPQQQDRIYANSNLASAIDFDGLIYDNGSIADNVSRWYGTPDNLAVVHRLRRNFEAHNIEFNLLRNPYRHGGCSHFELIAGFRYLQLNEEFGFDTNSSSESFGSDPANELFYEIDVDNHLFGFQIGGRMDHYIHRNLAIHGGSKFGLFGNHITHRQSLISGNGVRATNLSTDDNYQFNVSDNEVAFIGELFAGVSYDVSYNWRLTGGYRAVAACGVARSTSNIPRTGEFGSAERYRATNSTDYLLLHGAHVGIEYNW
ncbi:MAG: BBP7 family outer membrane beta-barrel protein [Planctomycetaceae bacterium]|nr:BBP7 family outer membrane beta-barrel protein [Planctomycetaceae bacterium]